LQLLPGALAAEPAGPSALKLALGLAWGCLILAGVAVAVLLRGVLVLSERRAAFVSAVSHELRTPLTTFRLYSEMLCDGMVSDEARQRGYLETLRAEADRLTHLVENVLAYSRLERGRPGNRAKALSVGALLNDGTSQRLAQRAAQAGFNLNVSCDEALLGERVVADRMAVEQILFNLVDNACKYAASADDRRLDLAVARQAGRVLFSLRDRGPGVSPRERRRLFRPFHKSAGDAANSAPGVGLGLALSRRLARDLGGRLDLAAAGGPGACFVLALPLARQP
jgi:signal transduction histidine kinase